MLHRFTLLAGAALCAVACSCAADRVAAADAKLPTFTDPAAAGPDFLVQGEYVGEIQTDEGGQKLGVQVIALGDGKFRAVAYTGGLPGDGWDPAEARETYDGETKDGVTVFDAADGVSGTLADGVITVRVGDEIIGRLKRLERKSPTLGAKPPAGAVVLFDGSSAENFAGGKLSDDRCLQSGCTSKRDFRDFQLHVEFRTPFMPTARGQARGNSGVYLQNRYEVQVLDSFGLVGKNNECGGFYSIRDPAVNMCYPPLAWQTYDIDFTAARFDDAGTKTKNAIVTVRHNGVPVYENFELPKLTPGGLPHEAPGVGPFHLQDHGNPVRFRNIWVVEKK